MNWAITMTNSGKEPITDYTITDAMESPYGYTGTVSYKIESPSCSMSDYLKNILFDITD